MVHFGGWRKAAVLSALLAVSSHASAQWWKEVFNPGWWKDPFGIEQETSPKPEQPWRPTEPLPVVSAPKPPAQTLVADRPLTLPELTEFALLNNPRTRQAWLAARASAAALGVAKADDLPTITGGYSYTRLHPVSGTSGAASPWLTRWGPQISFSYTLYDFGAGDFKLEAAEYRLLAANLAQNRVLQEIVFQVEQAYYQLIGIDALVRVNEQALKNAATVLDAVQRRRDSGLATVADVYRTETQVAQARLTLTRSRGEFEKARGVLATVVGVPIDSALRVQTLSAPPQPQQAVTTIGTYLDRVKTSRPDLIAAEAQVRAAQANANAASKAGLPSIELSGSRVHNAWHRSTPGPHIVSTNADTLTLNVRIPIFSGFKDTYSVHQARVQAEQAAAARDVLYRQTQLEVWQAYYDLQTVTGSISSTEALVKSAEQTAQATLARYQGGFGTILDLITAQQDETSARTQRIQSYLDWYTVLARLNLSVGAGNLLDTKTETKK